MTSNVKKYYYWMKNIRDLNINNGNRRLGENFEFYMYYWSGKWQSNKDIEAIANFIDESISKDMIDTSFLYDLMASIHHYETYEEMVECEDVKELSSDQVEDILGYYSDTSYDYICFER